MHGREPGQRPEGVRDAPEIALADGDEVPHVAVLGHLGEQRLCQRKCLGELTLLRERPRSPDFGLDPRRGRHRLRCCHGGPRETRSPSGGIRTRKRRASLPASDSTETRAARGAPPAGPPATGEEGGASSPPRRYFGPTNL